MKTANCATTKEETRRRLLVLADYMATVPRRRLKQRSYVDERLSDGDVLQPADVNCGTSACTAGFATTIREFQEAGLYLDDTGVPTLRGSPDGDVDTELARFFGIKFEEAFDLFGLKAATPKQKSKQLRQIAENYR